jgi:hypothetical protein
MTRIALWRTRSDTLTHLRRERPEQIEVGEQLFALIDRCNNAYEASASSNTNARVCGLTLLKAKFLSIGAYSLILDGLAQEAGALMRPFVEYTELLTYFRRFPAKVDDALSDNLPSAGQRAKAIEGSYKQFREHLNEHASHSSYSHYSLSHLLEAGTLRFKKLQRMHPQVLERNIRDFAIQLYLLLHEAALGLQPIALSELHLVAGECDEVKQRVLSTFGLDEP